MRNRRRHPGPPQTGFTLIELVVVVAIVAVLSSLAVATLSGATDRYQLSRAVEMIERFDALARRDAHRRGMPIQAVIERQRHRFSIIGANGRQRQFRLPSRVKIGEVRMRRRVVAGGNVDLGFSSVGASPTYALRLQRGSLSRWLVVFGVSGQVIHVTDEGQIDALMSL